ncbi:MAG: phosphatidate cytidylyltransferase [Bacillota bacterium]
MKERSNLQQRFIGGTLFVVIIFGLILVREWTIIPFDIFAIFCGVYGSFELLRLLGDESKTSRTFLIVFAVLVFFANYWKAELGILVTFLLLFIVRSVFAIFEKHDIVKSMANFTFSLFYPLWIFTLLMAMNHWGDYGTIALLLVFMIGPFCDVGAYLFGMTIKGPKLCPKVSPNKTIAGAVGGVLGGIVGALTVYWIATAFLEKTAMALLENPVSIVMFIMMGMVGAICGEIGDLMESALKRSVGIKDSGKFLPGHGGMLDRFDGVIFVTVLVYLFSVVFIL